MPSSPSASSSRASSPLSSATPSSEARQVDAGPSTTIGRDNRSRTESTDPLLTDDDDESELTEEEEEEEVDQEEEEEEEAEEEEEEEIEEEKKVEVTRSPQKIQAFEESSVNGDEEPVNIPLPAHRNRRIGSPASMPDPVSDRSPSLTPPPDSARLKPTKLPPASPSTPGTRSSARLKSHSTSTVGEEAAISERPKSPEIIQVDRDDSEHDILEDDHEDDIQYRLQTSNVDEQKEDAELVEDEGDVTMRAGDALLAPSVVDEDLSTGEGDVPDEIHEEEAVVEDGAVEAEEAAASDINGDAEQEESATPALLAPIRPHSSHAPPPPQAAMRSLLDLELKFAALRDKLYLERMEEAAAEEEMLINGTHPALRYIYETLSDRRVKLHEVASRRHQAVVDELKRVRESEKQHVWTWWTEQRDAIHWEEFAETWSKRRRLAREKTEIETPRQQRPIPRVGGPKVIKAFDWCAGAMPTKLGAEEAVNDLAIMENRRIIHPVRNTNAHVVGSSQHASTSTAYWNQAARVTPSMNATLDRPPVTASTGPSQPRREGRTVPTATDPFDGGPRKRDRVEHEGAPSNSINAWKGKSSVDAAATGRYVPNGHSHSVGTKDPSSGPAHALSGAAPQLANEPSTTSSGFAKRETGWTGLGFPSLSNYLERTGQNGGQGASQSAQTASTGSTTRKIEIGPTFGLFAFKPKANAVLSPPKTSTSVLGA
ncbi:hypothetical protein BD324DRAFT_309849 [Kockovaella imperatae]|uniref:Sds3-like-domain-containing protein n=1 Tax=Kockovaella imperatae TaxID=4999 RepID=A0A1Y1UM06_9TREE|nr:hypothetical protein BD324DRAFT_309849 [Kockovaella imperatae]ORX39080.1 hypothetical protein BD324DRAFT_309849 [Kockovaella imperatae]